jgi:ATP-dependent 26S proteasome regulatory subunit
MVRPIHRQPLAAFPTEVEVNGRPPMDYFAESSEHLLAELERIDLLIRGQVARVRKLQASDGQFRGLYISEQEVDALLDQPLGRPHWLGRNAGRPAQLETALEQLREQIGRKTRASLDEGIELRLVTLQQLFELSRFEIDTLLVCLAVEFDLRYERLYAYLQDDVTKKRPSVDLVLNLLQPSAASKLVGQQRFLPTAPLLRHHLVELIDDPAQPRPPLLAKYLKVDERVIQYLAGSDAPDHRIRSYLCAVGAPMRPEPICSDQEVEHRLSEVVRNAPGSERMVVCLRGPYGVGKQRVAAAVCRELGLRLLVVDLGRMAGDDATGHEWRLSLVNREARLQGAALYWTGFEAQASTEKKALIKVFSRSLTDRPRITFLSGEPTWQSGEDLPGTPFLRVDLPRPTATERSRTWRTLLDDGRSVDADLNAGTLATKFKFTRGQIEEAFATAEHLAKWRVPEDARVSMEDLYEACRLHSNQRLATLARKITPNYRWDDIVLPADRFAQLREICNQVKYRAQVYDDWGFDRKFALGKGLCVLFAGPSGTGKTMAADIIAGELGLYLYKIDLSTVVSKYIGETEKNLSRIFTEAESSNAILFFDEADALFGKRSEVKDSHDRYANIETGYLLQRMDEYEGTVILATNFRKNMDESFVRRLHFTIEFPFPNEEDRRRIWEGVWPEAVPRDPALDVQFLASRFQITGGNIRNIALSAAFLAADDSGVVAMQHLIRATQREFQKMGKVITDGEFREYAYTPSAQ